MTLPSTTCPTSSGLTPARLTASRMTVAPSCVGGTSFKLPPYVPIAVRAPLTTTTLLSAILTSKQTGARLSRRTFKDTFMQSGGLPLIALEGVRVTLGNRVVLDDVSWQLDAGAHW